MMMDLDRVEPQAHRPDLRVVSVWKRLWQPCLDGSDVVVEL